MDFGNIFKQAQKLQKEMQELQAEIAKREYEGSAGGDMVVVKVNGKMELISVKVGKEVVGPNDIGMLEDLILSATNAALAKAREDSKTSMKSIMGGLGGLPGMGGLNIPGMS